MPTPANATVTPLNGQLYNLSFVITSSATGNPLTGGLTALAAQISKNDGAFAATTNAPVEIGTSGFVSLDLTLAEMTANKILVLVTASNVGAVYAKAQINAAVLPENFIGRFEDQPVKRLEQLHLDNHDFLYNYQENDGAQQEVWTTDGLNVKVSGVITRGDTASIRSKLE